MGWGGGGLLAGDRLGMEGGRGGLTKKRMIHVSMTVRLAGRMENQDMKGGEQMSRWEAERYSKGNGDSIAWLSSSCGRSVVDF